MSFEGRLPDSPVIFALWHEDWMPFFVAFGRLPGRHVMINHPAASMIQIHVLLRKLGLDRLLLGSSGDEGRRAADELARELVAGATTTLSPDGPAGPPRELKRGILHVAAKAQRPVVPLRFELRPCPRLASWDRKKVPLPFSSLRIVVGDPIRVEATDLDVAEARLVNALKP